MIAQFHPLNPLNQKWKPFQPLPRTSTSQPTHAPAKREDFKIDSIDVTAFVGITLFIIWVVKSK